MAPTKIPISLQLYSVRHDAANDLLGVIAQVAKMGYQGVEFAGYHGQAASDIKKCLDDSGLKCSGAHVGWNLLMTDEFDATVEFHKAIGCDWLIIPWIPEELRNAPAPCVETAAKLTVLADRLRPLGLRTGFHAHGGDMHPLEGGKSAWDLLAGGTPKDFILQYDTANGVQGGADPVKPILDWPGRGQSVHLKEWKGGHGEAVIGEGDVPWAKVFEACESVAGTEWYVVEHEDEKSPALDAVDRCLKNLRGMGK